MAIDETLCDPSARHCPDAVSMEKGSERNVECVSTCPAPLRRDGDQVDLGAIGGDVTRIRRALEVSS
jgi:hypothetical protein